MEKIGYSYLIEHYGLTVLEQPIKCFLGRGSTLSLERTPAAMEIHYPERYRTNGTWQGHLLFAIKHEGPNPEVLKALFKTIDVQELTRLISSARHSIYIRRIWFFYEFLTGRELPVASLKTGNYGYVLPPDKYFCLDKDCSPHAKRQRLICNLPGNAVFCPMVRLTPCIQEFLHKNLKSRVTAAVAEYPAELIYRASAFLYLKETKSSYAIERQTPSQKRIASFMNLLQEAGRSRLDKTLLLRLQNAIVEPRYQEEDYRNSQVYVGQTLAPNRELIHFIGLKADDLSAFMESWLAAAEKLLVSSCDPVISAAVLSFAFVFIHPFEDGNGRLHRYLMHHVLNAKGFNPDNIIFPVSALLYKNARLYDSMLENFSKRLMPLVKFHLSDDGSMTVTNETADFYRYFDFTQIVEAFFGVVEETLKTELVPELDYLARWERIRSRMRDVVDMPDRKITQFILYVQQNGGSFPKRRRKEFVELSNDEIASLAAIVKEELSAANTKM
ncbi:MAG: Fic family protein, partial [Lentisphaeria bacterium]|nr:Fic family protein [Lentisphaeria bacterium]